jgi:hypothetical protein
MFFGQLYAVSIFIGMPSTFGFLLSIPYIVGYSAVIFAFDVLGVGFFPPSLFAVLSAVSGTGGLICLIFNFSETHDERNGQHTLAALMAVERLLGGQEVATTQQREKKKISRKEKLFISIKLAAPMLFTALILLFLIIGIFTAYRAVDHIALKVLVALFAQLIKVAGNKVIVWLCTMVADDCDPFINEANLFVYEYATALLCRFLQISLPDQNIAIGVSLLAALLEMGCRNFYFLLYVKAALKSSATFNKEEWRKFAIRGKMRVADASNDMIVEYLSTIAAALSLYYFGPTGAFLFAADESVSTSTIVTIVGFQLIPELVLDFYW